MIGDTNTSVYGSKYVTLSTVSYSRRNLNSLKNDLLDPSQSQSHLIDLVRTFLQKETDPEVRQSFMTFLARDCPGVYSAVRKVK